MTVRWTRAKVLLEVSSLIVHHDVIEALKVFVYLVENLGRLKVFHPDPDNGLGDDRRRARCDEVKGAAPHAHPLTVDQKEWQGFVLWGEGETQIG